MFRCRLAFGTRRSALGAASNAFDRHVAGAPFLPANLHGTPQGLLHDAHRGQEVRRDPGCGETRCAAGQGHGENQLVGQVRVARGVGLEKVEKRIHDLICHSLRRFPPFSKGGEADRMAPRIGDQYQEAPRPRCFRLHHRDVSLLSLRLEPPERLIPLPLCHPAWQIRHS